MIAKISMSSVLKWLALITIAVFTLIMRQYAHAVTGINPQLNYQGRLFDSTGAVIPDGDYNMEFTIVQDGDGCNPTSNTYPCSGTVKWTETRTGSNKVTVRNGYFSVNLGSVNPVGSSVDWNQDTLWLGVNIGGTSGSPAWDGVMKPMKRFTASPYALNADKLGGLSSSDYAQITANNNFTNTNTFSKSNAVALSLTGTPASVGTSSLIQFTAAIANGSVNGTYIGINPASFSGNFVDYQVNGTSKFKVTSAGNVDIGGVYMSGGTQISSANLSNDSNLAKLNGTGPQTFTGNNKFSGTVLNAVDSNTAFQIQNAAGTKTLLTADTNNQQITLTGFGVPAKPVLSVGANTGGTLTADHKYYYKVTAMNGSIESAPSAEAVFAPTSFTAISTPGTASAALQAGSGLGIGQYRYEITFLTANGETTAGTEFSITTTSGNQQVNLTGIPTGAAGTVKRRIYRTQVGGASGSEWLVTTLSDNTTTSYLDTVADASLTRTNPPATNNAYTNTNNISISFTAVPNATSYRIYRGTASGSEGIYQTTSSSPFTDTGATGTLGSVPTTVTTPALQVNGLASIASLGSCNSVGTDASGNLLCDNGAELTASKLTVFGHSIALGSGASDSSNTWWRRLSNMLHAQPSIYAVSGAIADWNQQSSNNSVLGDGGYASVLQNTTSNRTSAPYLPLPGPAVAWYGGNDLAAEPSGNLNPYKQALRTIISRLRASAIFEESSSTVTYPTGTWNTVSNTQRNSGSGYKASTNGTASFQLAVPTDFTGGTVDVGLVGTSDGNGSLVTCTEGGSTLATLNTANVAASGKYTGLVMRMTGLAAGSHTILCTLSSATGTGVVNFDYWQIESNPSRLVIVPLQYKPIQYGLYQSYSYHPTDADIDTLNNGIKSVAAEFDSSVITPDTDSVINKNPSLIASDETHPNDLGHANIASAFYNAMQRAPLDAKVSAYSSNSEGLNVVSYWTSTATSAADIFDVSGAAGGAAGNGLQGGNGAAISMVTGNGGAGTSSLNGGAGGAISITSGSGGSASSGAANGSGGTITLQGGAAGSGTGTAAHIGYVLLQPSGGNVGIGVSAPAASLDVAGSGTAHALIGDPGCGSNYVGISLTNTLGSCTNYTIASSPAGDLYMTRPSSKGIYILDANASGNQLTLLAGGNVGIGSVSAASSPTSLFVVAGSQPAAVSGAGTAATQVLAVTGGKGGNTTGTTTTAGAGASATITAGAGGNATNATANTATAGAGGSLTFTAGAGGTNSSTGNRAGAAAGSVTIQGGTGGNATGSGNNSNGGSITLQGGAPGIGGSGTAGSYGDLFLQTSGGNVGIGAAPSGGGLLSVSSTNGGVSINNPVDGSGLILQGVYGGVTSQLRIVSNSNGWADSQATAYFQIQNSSNKNVTFMGGTYGNDVPFDRLQFNSTYTSFTDGSFTTTPTPTSILELISTTSTKNVLLVKGDATKAVQIQNSAGTSNLFIADTTNARIGIGTAIPSVALDVTGAIKVSAGLTVSASGITVTGNSTITGTLGSITTLTAQTINATTAYQANGTAGVNIGACGANQYFGAARSIEGIITAGSCTNDGLSDIRIKQNIIDLNSSILDKIKNVRTVNFDFNCGSDLFKISNYTCLTDRQTGVIAQELAQVFPELVTQDKYGIYNVNYKGLNIYTLKAVSELSNMINSNGDAHLNNVQANTANLTSLNVGDFAQVKDLTVSGTAIFQGDIHIQGHIIGNNDTRGSVTIPSGQTSIRHDFTTAYTDQPYVVASLSGKNVFAEYSIDTDPQGFTIYLKDPSVTDVTFNYLVQQ